MFGFGKATCILCDRRVSRKEAFAVRDYKGFAICRRCVDLWRSNGGTCARCRTPLRGGQEAGIFMEGKRSIGHADCGALTLIAA